VYRQSARRLLEATHPAVGCHYFPPLPSQPKSVTAYRPVPNYTYTLYGTRLNRVNEVRDLGVLIDTQLSFKSHINAMVAKAHMRAGQISRCF